MKKLLKNKIAVGVLAIVAICFVYVRVVSPILDMTREQSNMASSDHDPFDDPDSAFEDGDIVGYSAGSKGSLESELGNISIRNIRWNDQPERDPFAPKSVIEETQRNAVSEMLQKPVAMVGNFTNKVVLPRVSAVINAPSLKFAVMDGDIVEEGETHKRFRVQEIDTGKVYLSHVATKQVYEVTVTE